MRQIIAVLHRILYELMSLYISDTLPHVISVVEHHDNRTDIMSKSCYPIFSFRFFNLIYTLLVTPLIEVKACSHTIKENLERTLGNNISVPENEAGSI